MQRFPSLQTSIPYTIGPRQANGSSLPLSNKANEKTAEILGFQPFIWFWVKKGEEYV
jgi:hypothetical protein